MTHEEQQRGSNIDGLERCSRLLDSPDFRWYVLESITKPKELAEKKLKDTATTKDAREIAANVFEALDTAEKFVTAKRDHYQSKLPTK